MGNAYLFSSWEQLNCKSKLYLYHQIASYLTLNKNQGPYNDLHKGRSFKSICQNIPINAFYLCLMIKSSPFIF